MIGFLGGGNMAEALIKGLTSKGVKDIIFYDPSVERIKHLMEKYGVGFGGTNVEIIKRCSILIIAVKPQIIDTLIDEIHNEVDEKRLFISIAAGIKLSYLSKRLSTNRIIRVMPNTPALVQTGMSVISSLADVSHEDLLKTKEIFETVGKVLILPEENMDAVTALSGSGPGFLSYIVESMIKAAVKIGLSEEDGTTMAIQTFIGTAKVLETGIKPERLREMVTSPKGTTFAGLEKMRELDFDRIIYEVLLSAKNRSLELGKG
ncbi:MAG: pyrroline-5-carboxylate reductase [Thermodesulfovibrionales bacterium]|nr:pyrroline-5-carboxylate reductase [Thermodesulfovibrionales bacterium]